MKFSKTVIVAAALTGLGSLAMTWPIPSPRQQANNDNYQEISALLAASSANDQAAGTNRDSMAYRAKAAQLNSLMQRLQNGQPVSPQEFDSALRQ